MKSFFSRSGFTILELVISILISFIILSGLAYFFVQISGEIEVADNKTKVYLELSDFIQQANILSRQFPSGFVYSGSGGSYDALIFTNSGSTKGAIIGIVSRQNNKWKLDPSTNFNTYGEKRIALKELSKTEMTAHTWSGIIFPEDRTYSHLIANSFRVTPYNVGELFDVNFNLYGLYDDAYAGTDVRDVKIQENTELIPLNLVF